MTPITRTLAVAAACTVLLATTPAQATYRGRNGRIAFAADRGKGPRIYTIGRNGSDLTRVTDADAGSAVNPDWSPDGALIVFGILPPGEDSACTIDIVNSDGSGLRRVAGNPKRKRCVGNPAFTPDGNWIVFTWRQEKIRSMDLHGDDRRGILDVSPICAHSRYPDCTVDRVQVSPDGRSIAFELTKHLPDGNTKGLFTSRMNGTHVERVVPFRFDVCVCGGDWAPDGERLVISDNAGDGINPITEPQNLATIRPDGTGLRYLTHNRSTDVGIGRGSYAPDGRWILYKVIRDGKYSLWKIRPNGRHDTRIARLPFDPGGRDWGARTA